LLCQRGLARKLLAQLTDILYKIGDEFIDFISSPFKLIIIEYFTPTYRNSMLSQIITVQYFPVRFASPAEHYV
jgi:hypothetical protein